MAKENDSIRYHLLGLYVKSEMERDKSKLLP